ncbi:hypothetical protein D3C81_1521690 [compost metagenome]
MIHSLNYRWCVDSCQFKNGRDDINSVMILAANATSILNPVRIRNNKWIFYSACMNKSFVPFKGRVSHLRPADWIMIVCSRGTQLINMNDLLLGLFSCTVEIFIFIPCAYLLTFRTGSVIGYKHYNRIVVLFNFLQCVEQSADVIIRMIQKTSKHFLHSCKQPLFRWIQ